MKRLLIMLVLLAGVAYVAIASFSNHRKSSASNNKVEKKEASQEKKKQCKRTCLFS